MLIPEGDVCQIWASLFNNWNNLLKKKKLVLFVMGVLGW